MLAGIILIGGVLYFTLPDKSLKKEVKVKPTGQIKEFDVRLFNWDFEPKKIEVNAGDKVILHVISTDIPHGIGINEFLVNKRVDPGATTTVEFIADKRGTFRMYCTVVCGAGHLTMDGTLTVK